MKKREGRWEARVERKLHRWSIAGVRRIYQDQFIKNMKACGKDVAPRVAAAVWGMAWNRWCTARRFQHRGTCVLGCDRGSFNPEDAIEHYWSCEVGKVVGRSMLRVEGGREQRKQSMLNVRAFRHKEERVCWHLLVYGLYMASNQARHENGPRWSLRTGVEAVKQHIRNGVEGHAPSRAILNGRWKTTKRDEVTAAGEIEAGAAGG